MTLQLAITTDTLHASSAPAWSLPDRVTPAEAGAIVASFLDAAATSMGRSTHYDTREEQESAERSAHGALLALDRDLYALLLTLPGVTDRARMGGVKNLLSIPRDERSRPIDALAERRLLRGVVGELPAQRTFKLFGGLRAGSPEEGIRKANNARTRKLVLATILSSPRIELWAVKYRARMRAALTHAWGQRTTSVVRSILAKADASWSAKERSIVRKEIDRFAAPYKERAYECVGFVLGNENRRSLPLIAAFAAAKRDLAAGKRLPPEVLEGIRSVYHKGAPKEDVLRITAESLTRGQRLSVQTRARDASVEVKMDPADYDPVRLYVHAFEAGMSPEIARALLDKAEKAAAGFPVRYGAIGVLVDASASMLGGFDQRLRPMAAVLALRDMLRHVGRSRVVYAGGAMSAADSMLVCPSGDTSLAEGLVDLLADAPEAIFVLSDGYENRPRGRFAEVVRELRAMGIETPIYHLNPVFAAESKGVRELAPGQVPTLPADRPEALGISFLRAMLVADPVRGITTLVRLALPARGPSPASFTVQGGS